MARQRFIWPSIWGSRAFSKLSSNAKLLFIGLFSNADDEGRIIADPVYLKNVVWPRGTVLSTEDVENLRAEVVATCKKVKLYRHAKDDFIQLMDWLDHQTPKYPLPSKLPAPRGFVSQLIGPDDKGRYKFPASRTCPGLVRNMSVTCSPRDGLGREREGIKKPPVVPLTEIVLRGDGAQELTSYYVDSVRALGTEAPKETIGMVASKAKKMLEDGVSSEIVKRCIDLLVEKRLHPNTLPSLVVEAAAGPRKPTSTHPADIEFARAFGGEA